MYSESGPPGYVVFKDVDYTNEDNFATMNQIAAEMTSTLNETVLAPVDSWVGPFQNFITKDLVWDAACESTEISVMGFDQQMTRFVQILNNSTCCQKFGICGERYNLDIIFNDSGKVTTTRLRFQHQVQKTQQDYIDGLVVMRK